MNKKNESTIQKINEKTITPTVEQIKIYQNLYDFFNLKNSSTLGSGC